LKGNVLNIINPFRRYAIKDKMSIMGPEGNTKLIWDSEKPDEVKNARENFERLTGKGHP
jgi:hypothetical protein